MAPSYLPHRAPIEPHRASRTSLKGKRRDDQRQKEERDEMGRSVKIAQATLQTSMQQPIFNICGSSNAFTQIINDYSTSSIPWIKMIKYHITTSSID